MSEFFSGQIVEFYSSFRATWPQNLGKSFLTQCSESEIFAKESDVEKSTVYMDRWVTALSTIWIWPRFNVSVKVTDVSKLRNVQNSEAIFSDI